MHIELVPKNPSWVNRRVGTALQEVDNLTRVPLPMSNSSLMKNKHVSKCDKVIQGASGIA